MYCPNGQPYVLKFSEEADKEAKRQEDLRKKGVLLPTVYHVGRGFFLMEYISGVTFKDFLEERERKEESVPFWVLLSFLARFYQVSEGFILGDPNLRNFILQKETLFGLDLEEMRKGEKEEDVAGIMAHLLLLDPKGTPWKMRAVEALYLDACSALTLSPKLLHLYFFAELEKIAKRRGEVLPKEVFSFDFSPYL